MARHRVTPGVIHLTGLDTDVRCLDVNPVLTDQSKDVGKLCGLVSAAGVAGELAPGQPLTAGGHWFPWDDIEWIRFVDPLKTSVGDRCAE
ncbi:hypothetical protein GCM10027569_87440 [Flindersiella endophytica]